MLTFKEYLSLLEAKIDDYKEQETNISTEHDPDAPLTEPKDIVDHFHAHNPAGNIQHTKKVVDWYKKGHIKQEDAPAMKDMLTNFNKHKNSLKKKKLEQYKTHGEVQEALHPFIGTSKSELAATQTKKDMDEGTTVVHDSPNVTLRHIHTKEGSIAASTFPDGKRPPWCTAREDNQNMFDHYNQRTGGKLYYAHLHNEQYPFNKLGIGVGADEFQGADNTKLEGKPLKSLVDRNPELKEIPELQGVSIHTTKPENVQHHIHDLMDNDAEGTHNEVRNNPEKYSKEVHDTIRQHSDEMEQAEDRWADDNPVKNSKFKSVLKTLANSTWDKDILEHLSKHPDDGVKAAVAKNYSTPKDIRRKFLDHPNPMVRGSVALRDFPEKIRTDVVTKETNPSVLARHVMGDDSLDVQKAALANPKIGSEALGYIAHTSHHQEIHKAILEHPKTDGYALQGLVNNNEAWHNHAKDIASHHNAGTNTMTDTGAMGSIALITKDPKIHKAILNNPKSDIGTVNKVAFSTNDSDVQKAVIGHPHVGEEALDHIIHTAEDPAIIHHILNNHQGRLTHASLNSIKRKLGSKVPVVYTSGYASQAAIDNVRNEGKSQKPEKKISTKKLDLFSDDWFKE